MLVAAAVVLILAPIVLLAYDLLRSSSRRVRGVAEAPQDGGWAPPSELFRS
jgi:hypothetical protein